MSASLQSAQATHRRRSVLRWRRVGEAHDEALLAEQVALVAGNYPHAVVGDLLAKLLGGWILYGELGLPVALAWLACGAAVSLCAAATVQFGRKAGRGGGWMMVRMAAFSGAVGVVWGSAAILLGRAGAGGALLLLIPVAAGLCAAVQAFAGACLPVVLSFLVGILPPIIGALLAQPSETYQALGWGSCVFGILLVTFSVQTQRVLRQGIALRFANLDLVQRLRSESAALARSREVAEASNRGKSRFLAAASHDLRQPLHALGLFLDALAATPLSSAQAGILDQARAASTSAREMLGTLLDLSRMDAGVIQVAPQPFRLQPLLTRLERELGPQADARRLVYRTRETALAVRADPALVELILRNLISNAIRYTTHGGVLVGCRVRGPFASIEVWDTGIGIPPEQQQAVFREFHQLGSPQSERRQGLGLGLAIVDGLCRACGTEIELASRVGHGSVFRFRLPLAECLPVDDTPATALPAPRFEGRTVLIVDDEEPARLAMRQLLGSWGCACRVAATHQAALATAEADPPDLLVVDYRLGGLRTGAQLIADLRARQPGLPAIIVTADTAPDRLRDAQASGAALLHKPLDSQHLREVMATLLAG